MLEADFESESRAEQREAAAPAPTPPPRGRPWVKGQSGNPRGRPSRAHKAAFVAHGLIDRNTVPLVKALVERALAGDRTAMRLCIERLAPPRREATAYLRLPPIENRRDVIAALQAVADAAAQGAIPSAQADALVHMLREVFCAL